jgi:hypothetical protein
MFAGTRDVKVSYASRQWSSTEITGHHRGDFSGVGSRVTDVRSTEENVGS